MRVYVVLFHNFADVGEESRVVGVAGSKAAAAAFIVEDDGPTKGLKAWVDDTRAEGATFGDYERRWWVNLEEVSSDVCEIPDEEDEEDEG